MLDHFVGEIELAVQLESARLHRECARGSAGFRAAIDDAHSDVLPPEPQRQCESGGAGANDEDLGPFHAVRSAAVAQMGSEQMTLTVRNSSPGLTVMSRRTSRYPSRVPITV